MNAFGVQIKGESKTLEEANARSVIGVNEGDEVERREMRAKGMGEREQKLLCVPSSLIRRGDRNTEGDTAVARGDEQNERSDGCAVCKADDKTPDFLIGKKRISAVLVNHFSYMLR